jgi:TetR/AcrR family transcriptional repressor of uid operon
MWQIRRRRLNLTKIVGYDKINEHSFIFMEISMPKVTDAYLETRRQQILDAAITCFARKGFHQTTMEEIGHEAGLSPGVAYRYFDNKDDIILATVQGSVDRSGRFFEAKADEEDTLSVLEQMIDDSFRRFDESGRDIYYKVRVQFWAETIRNPKVAEKARLIRQEAQERLAAVIREGQERGQLDPNLDVVAVAVAIMASHDGFVLHWLADPEVDVWQYRNVLMAMVRGLFNHKG